MRGRRDRVPVFVDHEAPVGVAVERQPQVGARPAHLLLQVDQIGRLQRVGLVVGKGSVEVEVERLEVQRQPGEHRGHRVAGHAIAGIHDDVKRADVFQIDQRSQVPGVVLQQIPLAHLTGFGGYPGIGAVQHRLGLVTDAVQTGVQAQRHGAGQAEFDAVVPRRVVRRGEHGSRQPQEAGGEVQQVGGPESGPHHIQAGGRDSLGKGARQLRRRIPHVVRQHHGPRPALRVTIGAGVRRGGEFAGAEQEPGERVAQGPRGGGGELLADDATHVVGLDDLTEVDGGLLGGRHGALLVRRVTGQRPNHIGRGLPALRHQSLRQRIVTSGGARLR